MQTLGLIRCVFGVTLRERIELPCVVLALGSQLLADVVDVRFFPVSIGDFVERLGSSVCDR